MPYTDITTSGTDALLSNLNTQKATSPDGISPRVLKEMHISIFVLLKVLFDYSLNTGVVEMCDTMLPPLY